MDTPETQAAEMPPVPTPRIGDVVGPGGSSVASVQQTGIDGTQYAATQSPMAAAVEASITGLIRAQYALALQRPRNIETVRNELLAICESPTFAEKAWYKKPIGGARKAEGLSIRFAEEAIKVYRNAMCFSRAVFDDQQPGGLRVVNVTVIDIERNVTWSTDLTIPKRVERSTTKGRTPIGPPRKNSSGDNVYLLAATDDEMLQVENAAVSKAARNAILRVIPEYILEDCVDRIQETNRNQAAKDPRKARKKIFDSLYALGIDGEMVEMYLGHPVDQASPAEIAELRGVYQVIADGEATWPDIIQAKGLATGAVKKDSASAAAKSAAEKIAARRKAAEEKEAGDNGDGNGNGNNPDPPKGEEPKTDPPKEEPKKDPPPEPKPEPTKPREEDPPPPEEANEPEVDGPVDDDCLCPNGAKGKHYPDCGALAPPADPAPETTAPEDGETEDLFAPKK